MHNKKITKNKLEYNGKLQLTKQSSCKQTIWYVVGITTPFVKRSVIGRSRGHSKQSSTNSQSHSLSHWKATSALKWKIKPKLLQS